MFTFSINNPFDKKQTVFILSLLSIFAIGVVVGIFSVHYGFFPNKVVVLFEAENKILAQNLDKREEEVKKLFAEKVSIENELEAIKNESIVLKEKLKCSETPRSKQVITSSTSEVQVIFNEKAFISNQPTIRNDGVFEITFEGEGNIFPEKSTVLSSDPYYSFVLEDRAYHLKFEPAVPFSSRRIFMSVFPGEEPRNCH